MTISSDLTPVPDSPFSMRKILALIFLFLSGLFSGLFLSRLDALTLDRGSDVMTVSATGVAPDEFSYGDLMRSPRIREVYTILEKKYYHFDQFEKKEIENGIINGIIGSLGDKHSEFFTPEGAQEFYESLSGDFEGIGAVIDDESRGVMIERVIKNSPAERAELRAGYIIVEVDDESIAGITTKEAVKKIRGAKGTPVKLKLFDPIGLVFLTKTVIRDSVVVPSVESKILTGGTLGYIAISVFGENTDHELSTALIEMKTQSASGIIIDLRYNGGGYMTEAVKMISHFFDKNLPVVTTKETDSKKNQTLFSTEGTYKDIPLVFLVNGMSASASEIMVGAIQDYSRGIVVGEKTYGKGSVQQPFTLSDGSEMKITIAKWYTPKDRGIDGKGIEPDIIIPVGDEDYKNKYDRQLEEAKNILDSLIQTKNLPKTIEIQKQRIENQKKQEEKK